MEMRKLFIYKNEYVFLARQEANRCITSFKQLRPYNEILKYSEDTIFIF